MSFLSRIPRQALNDLANQCDEAAAEKVRRVMKSCTTVTQLQAARRYRLLAEMRWGPGSAVALAIESGEL